MTNRIDANLPTNNGNYPAALEQTRIDASPNTICLPIFLKSVYLYTDNEWTHCCSQKENAKGPLITGL